MSQRISISYHDNFPYYDGGTELPAEIRVSSGQCQGIPPYALIQFGMQVDIYITVGRLQELQSKIADYLAAPQCDAQGDAQGDAERHDSPYAPTMGDVEVLRG